METEEKVTNQETNESTEVSSETNEENNTEVGTQNEEPEKNDIDSSRPVIVSLKDRQVFVNTLKITMSFKFIVGMWCSLISIAGISAITAYLVTSKVLPFSFWIVGGVGVLYTIFLMCICMVNLRNWVFTMNEYNQKFGEWAMEDVVGICQDLISAGVVFAENEVKKAKGEEKHEETPTEEKH